jgi:hypothetical protein
MGGFIGKVVAQKAGGNRPSPLRAAAAAVVAGAAAAGLTYRFLRSGDG